MNYLVCSDIHCGLKQSSEYYLSIDNEFFDDLISYANNHGIKKLIIAGDLFDTRRSLNQRCIDVTIDIFEKLSNNFDIVYVIAGNHDLYYTEDMSICSLKILYGFKNVIIVKEPCLTDGMILLPWLFDKDEMVDNPWGAKICIGHFEINGITLNSSGTVADGYNLNQSDFNGYDLVLSGHFHKAGKYGNIHYLGAPFQHNFNDIGNVTGFYSLDTDTCELKFIEFTNYAKHFRIKDTDEHKSIRGNIIELYFTNDYGIEENRKIVESVQEEDPYKLIVKYFNTNQIFTDDGEDAIIGDKLDMLIDFYDKSELTEGINSVIIKKIITKLYNEVIEDDKM